jgi:hypothetical protein
MLKGLLLLVTPAFQGVLAFAQSARQPTDVGFAPPNRILKPRYLLGSPFPQVVINHLAASPCRP